MSTGRPTFKLPENAGKYVHPWLKPLPKGRASAYDLAYRAVVTGLIAFAVYGSVEVARGSYYIMGGHKRAVSSAARPRSGLRLRRVALLRCGPCVFQPRVLLCARCGAWVKVLAKKRGSVPACGSVLCLLLPLSRACRGATPCAVCCGWPRRLPQRRGLERPWRSDRSSCVLA